MKPAEWISMLLSPGSLCLGMLSGAIAMLADSEFLLKVSVGLFSLGTGSMFLCGVACIYWSWRRAKRPGPGQRDIHEFLLGFFGVLMLVFGVVLAPAPIWQLSEFL